MGRLVRTITCDLGALAVSASATVQIGITPTALGALAGRATVGATASFDVALANNVVELQTLVQATVAPRPAPARGARSRGDCIQVTPSRLSSASR